MPLHCVVMDLAQSLTLLRLEFLAMIGARLGPLLIARADLDRLVDLRRRVAGDIE